MRKATCEVLYDKDGLESGVSVFKLEHELDDRWWTQVELVIPTDVAKYLTMLVEKDNK